MDGPSLSNTLIASLAVADFNGDGNLDLALIDDNNNKLILLLGKGNGAFVESPSSQSIRQEASVLVAGDFNHDGIPDLAVSYAGPANVDIFLGKGDGSFAAATATPTLTNGTGTAWMAVGDLNGDGNLDLVLADLYSDAIGVLLGKADGTFTLGGHGYTHGMGPIALADFNGDGKLDLVQASLVNGNDVTAGDKVQLFAGEGDGTFAWATTGYGYTYNSLFGFSVGDFNGDGVPDVAAVDSSGNFTVFMNDGKGAFAPWEWSLPAADGHQTTMAAGDFDGDGRTDLAIWDQDPLKLYTYLTRPAQVATAAGNIFLAAGGQHKVNASFAGNTSYSASISSNVDLWGAPPATTVALAVTAGGKNVTSVTPGTTVTLTASAYTSSVLLVNGLVNFCDAAAPSCSDMHLLGTAPIDPSKGVASITFFPAAGTHRYKAVLLGEVLGKSSTSNVVTLTVGPARAPTYTDSIALASTGLPADYSLTATLQGAGGPAAPSGTVSFVDTSFSNKVVASAPVGTATPGAGWKVNQLPSIAGYENLAQVAADLNGDGTPDLAVLTTTQYGGDPLTLTILLGKGDGTFTKGSEIQPDTTNAAGSTLIARDFNRDGKIDLAILTWKTNTEADITLLPGKGDGTFGTPIVSVVHSGCCSYGNTRSLAAADFNGDGLLDLAITGFSSDSRAILILPGKGDGTFGEPTEFSAANTTFAYVATGDFNGDGIPDLLALDSSYPKQLHILLGKGDGTFTQSSQMAADTSSAGIAPGDFDGDGKLDLAFCDGQGVTVLPGKGDGTFGTARTFPTNYYDIQGLIAADFNGDGHLDLAGLDDYENRIVLFEGDGKGGFKQVVTTPVVSQSLTNSTLLTADFNRDGTPDIALTLSYTPTPTVLIAQPTQNLTVTVNGVAPVGAGTHNVVASYGGDSHYPKAVSSAVQLTAGLKPPVITPSTGTFNTPQKVTITEALPGATIYYQASGAFYTSGYVQYTGPFYASYGGSQIIDAYATEAGYTQSETSQATFTMALPQAPAPNFSLAAGSYSAKQTLTITEAAPGATIFYSTDGTDPMLGGTAYTGPITVSTSEFVAAIARAPGYSESLTTSAQYYIAGSKERFIYTVAGTGGSGHTGDGGQATMATLSGPGAIAADASGTFYFEDEYVIRKVDAATGVITTIAGAGVSGYTGDGGPAAKAKIGDVEHLSLDMAGNLYMADTSNCVVRKITVASSIITTVAGTGVCGSRTDGVPAVKSQLGSSGLAIAFDASGNLYIGGNSVISKVDAKTGIISTIAGNPGQWGGGGWSGDGGPALQAGFSTPGAIAFDGSGNLYFADSGNNAVRKINAKDSIISTVAGLGPYGWSYDTGDGGPATKALIRNPTGLVFDKAGNMYITEPPRSAIREVTTDGIIQTIAGGHYYSGLGGDGGSALAAYLCLTNSISIDGSGNLYLPDGYDRRVRLITPLMATPTELTPSPTFSLAAGTYPSAKSLTVNAAAGVEAFVQFDGATPAGWQNYIAPIPIAGNITVEAMALKPGKLPSKVVTGAYKFTGTSPATIGTLIGSGTSGISLDGTAALKVQMGEPVGIARDKAGNLYMVDWDNAVVWKMTAATSTMSIVAGTPLGLYSQRKFTGEGGLATNATLYYPYYVAVDPNGNLFISDYGAGRVLKVDAKTGILTTAAGGNTNVQSPGYGDGGPATQANVPQPFGIAFDSRGNLFIADGGPARIRRVDAKTGIITSVAGSATATSLGDGGPATAAKLSYPYSLAFDSAGDYWIGDIGNELVRRVDAKTGIITTVAGTGGSGETGDGGPALKAAIVPYDLAVDNAGAVYVSTGGNTIRKFTSGGNIDTVVGMGYNGFRGDGGPARMAELYSPAGVLFDASGNLLFADCGNYRVRKVTFAKP